MVSYGSAFSLFIKENFINLGDKINNEYSASPIQLSYRAFNKLSFIFENIATEAQDFE